MTNNEKELHTGSGDSIQYSGSVEVSIVDSGRVLSKKTYHNKGCTNLFHSIAAAIGGNYNEAGTYRPYKIIAFKKGTNEQLYIPDPDDDTKTIKQFIPAEWNATNKVSTAVVYNGAPTIAPLEDGTGYKATFNFRLPFLTLVSGTNTKIAKLGLYPKTQSDYATSLCAYYILDEDQQISIPDNGKGGNFTIIITWVLKVTNAA